MYDCRHRWNQALSHSLTWRHHSLKWLHHSLTWRRHSLTWRRHSLTWRLHSQHRVALPYTIYPLCLYCNFCLIDPAFRILYSIVEDNCYDHVVSACVWPRALFLWHLLVSACLLWCRECCCFHHSTVEITTTITCTYMYVNYASYEHIRTHKLS